MFFADKSSHPHEKKLGNNTQYAFSFHLLNREGSVIECTGFQEQLMMPLLSTRKILIALAVCEKIYRKKNLNLDSKIIIRNSDLLPGNSPILDQSFFNEHFEQEEKTIHELLHAMLVETDNTAADVLLAQVDGTDAINNLLHELSFKDIHLDDTQKKRFADYYQISLEKTKENIPIVRETLRTAFNKRETEEKIVASQTDSGTSMAMSLLLKALIGWKTKVSQTKEDEWLAQSAEYILNIMTQCNTSKLRIAEGVKEWKDEIGSFGHKTGTLGGMTHDIAFMQLKDERWMILAIYTCLSDKSLKQREQFIADITKDVVHEYLELHSTLEPLFS